eukprot:2744550-Rhodomonas_salina.4
MREQIAAVTQALVCTRKVCVVVNFDPGSTIAPRQYQDGYAATRRSAYPGVGAALLDRVAFVRASAMEAVSAAPGSNVHLCQYATPW